MNSVTPPISLRQQLKLAIQQSLAASAELELEPVAKRSRHTMRQPVLEPAPVRAEGALDCTAAVSNAHLELARALADEVAGFTRGACALRLEAPTLLLAQASPVLSEASAVPEASAVTEDELDALSRLADDDGAVYDDAGFLRRSVRRPGAEQLSRADVQALLNKLVRRACCGRSRGRVANPLEDRRPIRPIWRCCVSKTICWQTRTSSC